MLARGGNAVDAALATAITLTVVEPCSNGIGSDFFAILWDGSRLVGLNASGRAPAGWNRERFAAHKQMPQRGWDTVTIPGAVSGWVALSKRYGKLPFGDLFEPAIRYARDGYAVSPVIAQKWALAAAVMPQGLGWQDHFLIAGRAPAPGERFRSPDMANTLSMIATTDGEAFYRGALAEAIVAHAQANDSVHARADFERHAVDWVTPIAVDYRGIRVHEIPPNGQGIAALMALGMLESFDLAALPPDSVASLHLQIEAMKLAFADAYRYVADLSSMTISPAVVARSRLSARACIADRSRSRAEFRSRRAAARRHRVRVRRRCGRDDGLADPIELHGLRLGRRRARNRHQPAESRRRIFARARSPERGRRRQATVPHDHSRLHDARRRAARNVRRHGRTDPAARSCADRGAHAGLRHESAGCARCAALQGERRTLDRSRGERVAGELRDGLMALGHTPRIDARFVHGLRRRPGDI